MKRLFNEDDIQTVNKHMKKFNIVNYKVKENHNEISLH